MSQLMLTPFLNILLLFEHLDNLSVDCVDQAHHELSASVFVGPQIFNKLLGLFLKFLNIIGLELVQNLMEQLNCLKTKLMVHNFI